MMTPKKLTEAERIELRLAEKYRRQQQSRLKARQDMIAVVLSTLNKEQLEYCLRLMQDAAEKTRDPRHREEALAAMEFIRKRLA